MAMKNVEDVYPLSPMQRGMLFHSLYSPGEGVYVTQMSCELVGDLDLEVLKGAWARVIERHAILRTGFAVDGLEEPLQVVRRKARLKVRHEDWRPYSEGEREDRWRRFVAADRKHGFDLTKAPLMRFALFQVDAELHRCLWTSHHILLDGWCLSVLLEELQILYEAGRRGHKVHLDEPPPYKNYIAWLQEQDAAAAETYWSRRLEGFEEVVPGLLSAPHQGGVQEADPEDRGEEEPQESNTPKADHGEGSLVLSQQETEDLSASARRLGLTVNTLVQGAFALLLSRYTDRREVIYGVVVSGRPAQLQGVDDILGLFINTLPFRVGIAPRYLVGEWLEGLQSHLAEMRQFEHSALTDIQRWSSIPPGEPLFENIIAFQNAPAVGDDGDPEQASDPVQGGEEPSLRIRGMHSEERVGYELSFAIEPGEELELTASYSRSHLSQVSVDRALSHFCNLLLGLSAAGKSSPLGQVAMLSAAERGQLLHQWNDISPPGKVVLSGETTRTKNLLELISGQVAERKGETALVFEHQGEAEIWTYGTLLQEWQALGADLKALGVGPEVTVAVSLPKGPQAVMAFLAVLEAGGCYLPIDPAYPAERIQFMLRDSQARWVLTLRSLAGELGLEETSSEATQALCLDDDPCLDEDPCPDDNLSASWRGRHQGSERVPPDARQAAYTIYTSGSTGQPKAVVLTHGGLAHLVLAQGEAFELQPTSRVLQFASLSFDASISEMAVTLASGAALCIATGDDVLPGPSFPALLRRLEITHVTLPPSALAVIPAEEVEGIRVLVSAGEPLLAAQAKAWADRRRMLNAYGPTEATVCATWGTVSFGAEDSQEPTPAIGRPLAGVSCYVLDQGLRPLPVGGAGELFIGGAGVGRGYARRPAVTAEKFVPDLFSGRAGARLYRSGDRVSWRPDGQLRFHGRLDHQVKIRGFRIELGEIENVLASHPALSQAAVRAFSESGGRSRLVGYFVVAKGADGETQPGVDQLLEHARGQLPDYMVPAALVEIAQLPLTPNGKVDRDALPEPEVLGRGGAAPRTPTEQILAGLWEDVLKVEQVGRKDDFFVLGGHSLLATQLVSRIRKSFQVDLPLRDLFEAPLLLDQAAAVEAVQRSSQGRSVPALVPTSREGVLPLSFPQRRLWFLDQLSPGSAAYNMPMPMRARGPLELSAVAAALSGVVERHEILRTRFVSGAEVDGDEARQVVDPPRPVPVPVVDLSDLPEARREPEARRLLETEAQLPFDLARGPLLRASVLRFGPEECWILATLHHIVTDGWSMGILVDEVAYFYGEALSEAPGSLVGPDGNPRELPQLPIQYADFAAWQRGWLKGDVLAAELGYWRQQLGASPAGEDEPDLPSADLPVLELPTDRPRSQAEDFAAGDRSTLLPAELSARLQGIGRKRGATLFMTLLSAFQALLSQLSGQRRIAVGSPIAGRNHLATEGLIGFFVNTQVLSTDLSGDPTFLELVDRARKVCLGAYAHQDMPFEKLVEELAPSREEEHSPLFQVMFTLQNAPEQPLKIPDLELTPLEDEERTAKFDLVLQAEETEPGLDLFLDFRRALFDGTTMERLLRRFGNLLSTLAAEPGLRLSQLPTLGAVERHQLLVEWTESERPYPREASLAELFAKQAVATPLAVAVSEGAVEWSYEELRHKARGLALALSARGVQRGQRVGLCFQRGAEMVAAILGVVEAGAVYVPLDPAYPVERLRTMSDDAELCLVLRHGEEELEGAFPQGVPVVSLEEILVKDGSLGAASEPSSLPGMATSYGGDLAYVMYTSGSTGRPKGIGIPHRAVSRLVLGTDYVHLTAADRVAQIANISFDAATFEIWGALLNGARLVVLPRDLTLSPEALGRALGEEKISSLFLTTALFNQLAREAPDAFRSARYVLFGGEQVDPAAVRRVLEHGAPQRLLHVYGPTENTTFSTWQVVQESPKEAWTVPIGGPVANSWHRVLDPRLEAVPQGVHGELCLGGDGLAVGYLGRPALTAQRFVPDAEAGGRGPAGGRLYRTGDRVRLLTDGAVEFLGRFDDQVKIRGFRIEPGEVEAVLGDCPQLAEAVVLVRQDTPGDRRLVAYAVPQPEQPDQPGQPGPSDQPVTVEDLRSFLSERLPAYMVPTAFVLLDALPLTANGKVDRRALPAPERHGQGALAPRTQTEQILAATWQEVLGLEELGMEENFFELGGHSLLATKVVSRLRHALRAEVPLRALFENPTVASLAPVVEAALRSGQGFEKPALEAAPRDGELPLSFAQQRLWFIDQLEPGTAAYNMPLPLRAEGPLDPRAVEESLGTVIRRHQSLRTRFLIRDGQPRQEVMAPPASWALPVVDLSGLPEDVAQARVRTFVERDAAAGFDLQEGPLLRASLLRLSPQEHAVLFNMHHIVGDGWSMGLLVEEVSEIYRASLEDRQPDLPDLPVQYPDFAVWQRSWLRDEVLQKELEYWRGQLEGSPAVLDLPFDRSLAAETSPAAGDRTHSLAEEVRQLVHRRGRELGLTPFMMTLAAAQLLLSRICGQGKIPVGTPIAGRGELGTEDLIGFFVNTLVVSTDVAAAATFGDLLEQVRERTLDAQAHQDIPFEKLVEEFHQDREAEESPLFQVMFTAEASESEPLDLPDLRLSPLEAEEGTAKFNLSLLAREQHGVLELAAEYKKALFDATSIERLLGHWGELLHAGLERPDLPLKALRFGSAAQRQQLTLEWAGTDSAYPREATLPELFEEQARRQPEAVALVIGQEQLTYGDLDRRANALAHRLVALGVETEDRVGLCLERSLEMVVATLGILKAGGAYLPLDPEYPQDRLQFMAADGGVRLALVTADLAPRLEGLKGLELELLEPSREGSSDSDSLSDASEAPPAINREAHQLAYVMYTSGSTGRPKGVAIPHRGVIRLVRQADYLEILPDEVFLQLAPTSFDAATLELWAPLLHGARLVLAPPSTPSLDSIASAVADHGVTTLHLTAGLFHLMVDERLEDLSGLRNLLAGGDLLSPARVRRVVEMESGPQQIACYGPTESTTFAACHRFRRGEVVEGTVPLGRPIADTRIYLVDRHLELGPMGVSGELVIGGDGLARGYWGRPALTAERFVPDPFPQNGSASGGGRLYRTGDRARWTAQGVLRFEGRFDDQVKIRGYRIEPGEVSAALAEHPALEASAVVVRTDPQGDKRLVGYAVPAKGEGGGRPSVDGSSVDGDAVRDWLEERLPGHLVPWRVLLLDSLPLTANSKLDRDALPDPAQLAGEGGGYLAPRDQAEELVAGIWAEVLGLERVGSRDDFFALGGHSLLATQVMARLRGALGVEVPLREIFDHPTVAGLASAAQKTLEEGRGVVVPKIEAMPREGTFPLSFAQQRLWFIEQLDPGSPAYNMPMPLRAKGHLDIDILEAGLSVMLGRHEVLRSRYVDRGGEPVQEIAAPTPMILPVVELSGLEEADRQTEMMHWVRREGARPFDLTSGPMMRGWLLRLAPQDHMVLFSMHHIASDGWSMGVLVDEVSELYGALRKGTEPDLDPLPIQYADFAHWQRGWLQGEVLEGQLQYWRDSLAGAPPVLELPTDRPRPEDPQRRAASVDLELSEQLSAGLRQLSRRGSATLFMTLTAALQWLLGRLSSQDDVSVGTPTAGRTLEEVENLIGFFVNTLVLRARFLPGDTFLSLLERVRETVLEAQAHQHLPFERLVEELQPQRDLDHPPLFRVMFALQNTREGQLELGELQLEPLEEGGGVAKFDLNMMMADDGETISGGVEYDTDLFDATTVRRLLDHYQYLLEQLAEAPDRPLVDLATTSAAQRHQLITEWSGTVTDYPRDASVPDLFSQQAAARPGAVALVCGEGRLTYEELDRRANGLARQLVELGVGVEDRVGLCAGRSLEMVVATLGILKAGAAYVPLDPEYPRERLRFMAEDSRLAVVLVAAQLATELGERLEGIPGLRLEPLEEVPAGDEAGSDIFEADELPPLPVRAEQLAYLMYTSGSTGRPKGVAIPHHAVVRLVRQTNFMNLDGAETFLQLAPISFDAATLELWGPLLNGGRLVLAPPGAPSLESLGETLARHGVTSLWLTAGLFHLMVDEQLQALAPLRQLLAGGDVLSPSRARKVLELEAGPRLINGYGPTEGTTFTACHRVECGSSSEAAVPIGRPVANTQVYVTDGRLQLQPLGVAGELRIAGEGLARGYWAQPALTAERFVPDPFGAFGGRLYGSGDRVRWSAAGVLRFEGRFDDQVKIRGYRVEPGEVAAALGEHPEVDSSVALVLPAAGETRGDLRLVAYAVLADAVLTNAGLTSEELPGDQAEGNEGEDHREGAGGQEAGHEEASPQEAGHQEAGQRLRTWLADRLPPHLVPQAVVVLEALPLTANGKVDRQALPVPEAVGGEALVAYRAPRTETEQLVAGIWEEVLGVDRVGSGDDFFVLGGHSLLATQVMSRLRGALGVEVPLRELFESPTVAGLAAAAQTALLEGRGEALPPLEVASREGNLPLSFAQQRLWFIDQLEPDSPAYNMPLPMRAEGPLNVQRMEKSLNRLVERHEVLRTRFLSQEGLPYQVIDPPAPFPLPVIDLRALEKEAAEGEARRWVEKDAFLSFDLATGPLLRCALLRLGDEEHVSLFSMHHIASDGWSLGLLVDEVSELYSAAEAGRAADLVELPIQYGDFAAWQRGWLQGEVLERELDFWRQHLAGAPPLLELPLDRPRPEEPTLRGATENFELELPLSRRLGEVCRQHSVTSFMALLSAWSVTLWRYCGQADVLVGTPVAGRTRLEVEDLIGFFVNTLVVRSVVRPQETFLDLLSQVREASLEAHSHQELPFERLVEELVEDRTLDYSPLFQVMFAFQNFPESSGMELPGLRLSPLEAEESVAKFDLNLGLRGEGERIEGGLEYATELFDNTTIQRLLASFQSTLGVLLQQPDLLLGDLPGLAAAERHQLLVEWNDPAPSPGTLSPGTPSPGTLSLGTPSPGMLGPESASTTPETLHDLVLAQVRRSPQEVAVVSGEEELTYTQLEEASARLAAALAALGVGAETRVGICLPRRVDLPVAVLAVLRAGAAYVPLDPAYPEERLRFLVEDSALTAMVIHSELEARLPEVAVPRLLVDRLSSSSPSHQAADSVPEAAIQPIAAGNLAYVIYTSGSTGLPKGVAIEHRSAVALVHWARQAYSPEELSGVLAATSLNFDLSVWELFVPLAWGGTVILADDALALVDLPARDQVRLLNTVPSAAAELLRLKAIPEGVRTINLAGEALPAGLVRELLKEAGKEPGGEAAREPESDAQMDPVRGRQVYNLYGPSEDTTYSTGARVDGSEKPLIGVPLAGARAFVCDRRLRALPLGARGELFLAGGGLARGYLGRPALTADRFVPNPFSVSGGERLYRTGDGVRWRRRGELEYLGRLDHQVKVRGYRIELEEIAAVLESLESVREAVVRVWQPRDPKSGAEDARLVAYVAFEEAPEEVFESAPLRQALLERLPAYMVPSLWVPLEALPRTPNGKVDRSALPAPSNSAGDSGSSYLAPRTDTEALVAGIWTEVLGVERVGVADDFFALGGHSLLATQVISRLRQALGAEVPLRALFESPTLGGFAADADAARRQGVLAPRPPLEPVSRVEPLPLSFGQQRLWFLDQLVPGNLAFNMPMPMRMMGELKVGILRRSLTRIVARHEVLRSRLESRDGEAWQVVDPPSAFPLPVVDLSSLKPESQQEVVKVLVDDEAHLPFDLARGPVLRAALLRLASQEHVGLFTLHHVVADAWSLGLLVDEVSELYQAQLAGRKPDLVELPVQYGDFAAWQRQWLQGDVLEAEIDFWRQALAGAPPLLTLPLDRPRPAEPTMEAANLGVQLGPEVGKLAERFGRQEGSTLFMVLLAAFQVLLARLSGQRDVVVGTPVAGRHVLEVEELIGFFVNTLALRCDLGSGDLGNRDAEGSDPSRQPSFRQIVARTREAALDAQAHQDIPFEKLVEELRPERSRNFSPIFQVSFALQNLGKEPLDLQGLRLEPFESEGVGTAKFDLHLALEERDGEISGEVEYAAEFFDATTVQRWVEAWGVLTEELLLDPQGSVFEASMLTPAQRHQLAAEWPEWPGREVSASTPALLVDLFQNQVVKAPTATALVQGSEDPRRPAATLSYQQLDRKSDALAAHLVSLGVGPEVVVGVALEKSAASVTAFLAVLKAGGCYLPLDPTYPRRRIDFMLRDSQVHWVIADDETAQFLDLQQRALDQGQREFQVISPRAAAETAEGSGESGTAVDLSGDSAAYSIYTSGSTGQPKGAVLTHGALASLARSWARRLDLGSTDRVLQVAALSFDVSIFDMASALVTGAALHLPFKEAALPGPEMAALLRGASITHLTMTPSALSVLPLEDYPRLRVLTCGAEPLNQAVVERWSSSAKPVRRLFNAYGPTEATSTTLMGECSVDEIQPSLGRPFHGVSARVVDQGLRPVPPGVGGELLLGGICVGRGYRGQAALTAARFVPDPFSEAPGQRVYRTGDQVRWRADGRLDFLGRRDQQIKLRGFRIEPGEVETALEQHPHVRTAVVVVRGGGQAQRSDLRRLVAYWVATADLADADLGSEELRAFLAKRLPSHLVPSTFLALEEIPRQASGKVDLAALPAPEGEASGAYVAPRDDLERQLVGIWEGLLDAGRIGVEANFFELGGHSLLAVQLVSAVSRLTGEELPVAALFRAPTIAELAEILRGDDRRVLSASLVPLRKQGEGSPLFWVHPGNGTIFLYRELASHLEPSRPFYALQSQGLGGRVAPLATIEGMAEHYIKEIRTVQPSGPYLLAGWSMGGVIAVEMARRLKEQGEETAFLGLVDSRVPDIFDRLGIGNDMELLKNFALHFGLPLEISIPYEEFQELSSRQRLAHVMGHAQRQGAAPPGLPPEEMWNFFQVFRANMQAVPKHRPGRSPAPISLFKAQEALPVLMRLRDETWADKLRVWAHTWGNRLRVRVWERYWRKDLGWGKATGAGVAVQRVEGHHFNMLSSEHVEALAARLGEALQQALEQWASKQRTGK
ncbi:MAG: non-ribosomal peptide synthase/polyketide synthase [Deltaproteobacteria bacterium]|nr:non-ribosomal peptide synthase/polyketide synthase [Deltaproteobacteria bacterium]